MRPVPIPDDDTRLMDLAPPPVERVRPSWLLQIVVAAACLAIVLVYVLAHPKGGPA